MKIIIKTEGPVLPGSISTANSRCGKKLCSCQVKPKKWHGPYYRWTGFVDGRRTTKTISLKSAMECKRRINRYQALKRKVDDLLTQALNDAPWKSGARKEGGTS